MAALSTLSLTLADWVKRKDPDGSIAAIVELLNQDNEILDDMMWMEANNVTGHTTTVRTGIPTGTWRMLNYGVDPEKSRTAQITDSIGMLETHAKVDKALAELNGNSAEFMLSENAAFIEGMNQTMAQTIFYGNSSTDPEKFTGLAPRFNSLSAENADQIINAGGAGSDNLSIWLVGWGDKSCHGIFPKGSPMGLEQQDMGEDVVQDSGGREYRALRTWYAWKAGLTVRDWRYIVRIANVDVSNLTKDASGSSTDLVDNLTEALERIKNLNGVRPVFYANRTARSFLRRQVKNSNNVHLSLDQVAGKRVLSFDGVPFKLCEALTNTEAAVS